MKTKLPEPQFSFEGDWYSEAQLRAAMRDAFNEGVEDAAEVSERCDVNAQVEIRKLKGQTP